MAALANAMHVDVSRVWTPPHEVETPRDSPVIAASIFRSCPHYVKKIVDQINVSYMNACYDGCAVLIRRLVETLIIEAYELYGIADQIQDKNGDFIPFEKLIVEACSCSEWNLGRNAKRALPRMQSIGNLSAHSRRYIAHRSDIDKIKDELRVVAQELILLPGPRSSST